MVRKRDTKKFRTTRRVDQGDILGSVHFSTFMDKITRKIIGKNKKMSLGYYKLKPVEQDKSSSDVKLQGEKSKHIN